MTGGVEIGGIIKAEQVPGMHVEPGDFFTAVFVDINDTEKVLGEPQLLRVMEVEVVRKPTADILVDSDQTPAILPEFYITIAVVSGERPQLV